VIIQGQPKKINYNRMILGRRRKSKSAVQIISDAPTVLDTDYVWRGLTEDAVATQLYINDDGESVFSIDEDEGLIIECTIIAKEDSAANVSMFKQKIGFYRSGSGNIIAKQYFVETIASDLAVTFEWGIDNTDYYIYPEVTGIAATDINWQILGRVNKI